MAKKNATKEPTVLEQSSQNGHTADLSASVLAQADQANGETYSTDREQWRVRKCAVADWPQWELRYGAGKWSVVYRAQELIEIFDYLVEHFVIDAGKVEVGGMGTLMSMIPNWQERHLRSKHTTKTAPVDQLVIDFPIADQVLSIPLDRIAPRPGFNPRKRFDDEQLEELRRSIEQHGLLQPITVRPRGDGNYDLVFGERRWRAVGLAGLSEIKAIISTDIDDTKHRELALIENLVRVDLDPIELARGYVALQEMGLTQQQIAERLHRAQPTVANTIRLLKLPDAVLEMVSDGRLSQSHGLALLKFAPWPEVCTAVAEIAIGKQVTSKQLESEAPGVWQLASKHGFLEIGNYQTKFDHEQVCKDCPFGAYVKDGSNHWCFKPEHYQELNAAAKIEQAETNRQKLVEQIAADPEMADVDIATIKTAEEVRAAGNGWTYLYNPPAGCTAECTCRTQLIDHAGKLQSACLDLDRLRKLNVLEQDKVNAERERQRQQFAEQWHAKLDGIRSFDYVGGRELMVILSDVLIGNHDGDAIARVAEQYGVTVPEDLDDRSEDQIRDFYAEIAPLTLAKMAIELICSESYSRDIARWYVSPPGTVVTAHDEPDDPRCRVCGCTDMNCSSCIERTGEACHWVDDLETEDGPICSACVSDPVENIPDNIPESPEAAISEESGVLEVQEWQGGCTACGHRWKAMLTEVSALDPRIHIPCPSCGSTMTGFGQEVQLSSALVKVGDRGTYKNRIGAIVAVITHSDAGGPMSTSVTFRADGTKGTRGISVGLTAFLAGFTPEVREEYGGFDVRYMYDRQLRTMAVSASTPRRAWDLVVERTGITDLFVEVNVTPISLFRMDDFDIVDEEVEA